MNISHDKGVGPETRHIATAQATEIRRHPRVAVTSSPKATATLLTMSMLIGRINMVTKCRNALNMRCGTEQRFSFDEPIREVRLREIKLHMCKLL